MSCAELRPFHVLLLPHPFPPLSFPVDVRRRETQKQLSEYILDLCVTLLRGYARRRVECGESELWHLY